MPPEVVPILMDRPRALSTIKRLSGDTSKVIQGPEIGRRMRQRKISWAEVIKVLQLGVITEGPSLDSKGCWRCTMMRFAAGQDVQVVVSICGETLVTITTF